MQEFILEAWDIHQRTILFLLDAVADQALSGRSQGMRSVGEMFAHVHNIRLAWIEPNDRGAMETLSKIPTRSKADKDAITIQALHDALQSSGEAMKAVLQKGFEKAKISGFKPHAAAFYSYLIGHEWYHVGEICMTLTQAGHKLPEEVLFGLWEWDKR